MNDFPPPSNDEQPAGGPTGEPEPTRPLFGQQQPNPFGYPTTPPPPTQHLYEGFNAPPTYAAPISSRRSGRRRGMGLAAGALAAALIVGGGAGFGTAALYHHHEGNSGGVFSSAGTTSTVVDEQKQVAQEGSVEAVAAKVLPSVVKIEVSGSTEAGSGSGIVLSSDGLIMTNNHVVEIAGKSGTIKVYFNDGSQADATIVGTDPLTDSAVIKAQGVSDLKPATIGKSSQLAVGQSVVAIGSPFGLDSTVTSGIVSALNRPVNVGSDNQGNATVYPAIQTDAAINPGNSGGALVDLAGNVVGINASIRSTTSGSSDAEAGSIGLGFAIPIDEVMPIIEQMIKGETPTHARLGISVSDVRSGSGQQGQGSQGQGGQGQDQFPGFPQFPNFGGGQGQGQGDSDIFTTMGAQVQSVSNNSAAEKAGIKKGDIITKVDDHLIAGSDSLVATVRAYRPGDTVTLTWTDSGKTKTAKVTLDSDASSSNS
jgi:putative serine protease PepD